MDAIALSCQKCGAALRAAGDERFLTCGYCRSRLEIVRTPDSLRTKVLEEMERTNAGLARELEATRIRLALSDLDRDWHEERESLMVRNREGGRFRPSRFSAFFTAAIGVGMAIFWIYFTGKMPHSRFRGADGRADVFDFFSDVFPYFFIFPAAIGLGTGWFLLSRARAYDRALARYEAARADLSSRLRALASQG